MKEFKKLDFPRLREYYTKYPQGYTIYESLLDILEHINEMTDVVNLTLNQWEQIETWVLTELKQYSIDQLQTWLDDGTLEQIINEVLFADLDVRVTQVSNEINNLNQKIDTNTNTNQLHNVIFNGTTTRFYAHRGLSAYYPENTLYAIQKASTHGFYGVEIDIQPTNDDEIILMHDDTVDRTTNGAGNVKDLNYDYIRGLKIDSGNGINILQEAERVWSSRKVLYVPTFEEVVKECRRSGLSIQVELKGDNFTNSNLDKVVSIVDKYNMRNKVLFISFNFDYLEYLRTLGDNLMLLYVVGTVTPSVIQSVSVLKNAGISASYTYNSSNIVNVINDCHDAGVPIGFWTVNDNITVRTLVDSGCDFITTDKIKGSKIVKSVREYTLTTSVSFDNGELVNATSYGGDDCVVTLTADSINLTHAVPFDNVLGQQQSGRSIMTVFDGGVDTYITATRGDQLDGVRLFIRNRETGEPIDHTNIPVGLWFSVICFNNDLG